MAILGLPVASRVQLKGPVEDCIGLGSPVERLPLYVADLDEPCLLGFDYLTESMACNDLGRRVYGQIVTAPCP